MATEVTSIASHTDLWRPNEGRLSGMVDKLGWRRLFPPLRKAWETLGTLRPKSRRRQASRQKCASYAARMISNAALVPHLMSRRDPFTVISTGTWVIIMAVGARSRLDPSADMLANVDVRGEPVPTARFMGGREFSAVAGDAPAEAGEADVAAVVASGAIASPAFSTRAALSRGAKGGSRAKRPRPRKGARRSRPFIGADDRPLASPPRSAGRSHRRGRLHPLARSPPCSRASCPTGGRRRSDERRRGGGCGAPRPLGRAARAAPPRGGAPLGHPGLRDYRERWETATLHRGRMGARNCEARARFQRFALSVCPQGLPQSFRPAEGCSTAEAARSA